MGNLEKKRKSKRTLLKRYWESDIYVTIRKGKEILFSNKHIWSKLFSDEPIRLVGAKGQWAKIPQFTLYLLPSKRIEFDEIDVKLSRNGKVWFHKTSGRMTPILMEPQDTFRITVPLKDVWNGR